MVMSTWAMLVMMMMMLPMQNTIKRTPHFPAWTRSVSKLPDYRFESSTLVRADQPEFGIAHMAQLPQSRMIHSGFGGNLELATASGDRRDVR